MKLNTLTLGILAATGMMFSSTQALAVDDLYNGAGVKVFKVGEVFDNGTDKNGFRIPAIKAFGNGILVAAADVRYFGYNGAWSDLVSGSNMRKTKIATKVSFDNGATWTELNIIGGDSSDYNTLATDPALVHDPVHNSTLIFGLRNNANLSSGDLANPGEGPSKVENLPDHHAPDFLMYRFNTETRKWDEHSIYDQVYSQINAGLDKKYSMIFQGPGSGMFYNGKLYVPIQAFAHVKDMNGPWDSRTSTSGFMTSDDGGETWEVSSMLIADPSNRGDMPRTSESNIFHHKGKIRMAVRSEEGDPQPEFSNHKHKNRLVYEYDEATKTWTDVTHTETFIPDDVARAETSTLALNEDVYLASYIRYFDDRAEPNNNRRKNQYLVTNTGIKLQLADVKSEGYTSITSDDENIYVMYEGAFENHDISLKVIDWAHKDYATLNTQILKRAKDMADLQLSFMNTKDSYIKGGVGNDGQYGLEMVYNHDLAKLGFFYDKESDINKDKKGVIANDTKEFTLMVGRDNLLGNDNAYFGFKNSTIEYKNKAENSVNSWLLGYGIQFDFAPVSYRLAVNGMWSQNNFDRNTYEGLGKTAEFNSYSFGITNELLKNIETGVGAFEFGAGLSTTLFGHDDFRENGGEGFGENGEVGANNALVHGNDMWSNELFARAKVDFTPVHLGGNAHLKMSAHVKYAFELNNSDDWAGEYRTMSVERKFNDIGELYSARDGGYLNGGINATLEFTQNAALAVDADIDSVGEKNVKASLRYTF